MDRVRLGRALGYGARHAARTVTGVVDAAMAPAPAAGSRAANSPGQPEAAPPRATPTVAQRREAVYRNVAGAKTHARGLGRSVSSPLKTFSTVVSLQVVGTLFAIFAAYMGEGVWRMRQDFAAGASPAEAHKLYFDLIAFLIFTYFTISSFVRASRRERRSTANLRR